MDLKATVQKLRDFDPAVRKEAIVALANSRDKRVLKPLKWVYENDDDPELRDLALRAAKYIRKKAETTPTPPPEPEADEQRGGLYMGMSGDDLYGDSYGDSGGSGRAQERQRFSFDDDYYGEQQPSASPPPRQHITDADRKFAHGAIQRALDLKIRGNHVKAKELVTQAFERNPELRHDTIATGLAADLFGMREPEVVAMLLDAGRRDRAKQQARAELRRAEAAATTDDFYNAVFWLIVYFILTFLPVVVGWALLDTAFEEAANDPTLTQDQLEIIEAFQTIGTITVVLLGVGLGVFQTFYQMVYVYSIHLVARFMFIGRGTYLGLLSKITQISIAALLLSYSSFAGSFIDPALGTALSCAVFFALLGVLYWIIHTISRHYDIGAVSGCMTVILSTILLVIGQAVLFVAFFTVLAAVA